MSGHTKGPWVIIPGGDEWSTGRIATIEPKPETMLKTNFWTIAEVNYRRDEHAANARLIAAAPNLLDALESIILNASPKLFSVGQLAQARAAIAKAKGEAK